VIPRRVGQAGPGRGEAEKRSDKNPRIDEPGVIVRFRIATLMTLVAASGLVLGLCSWLGWGIASIFIETVLPFLLITIVPFASMIGLTLALFVRGRLAQPIITCPLAGIALTVAPALVIGLFLTEPLRIKLERIALAEGILIGFFFGVWLHVQARHDEDFRHPGPDARRDVRRLNLSLAILAASLIAITWAVPRLKWGGRRSVGLAVAVDPGGWLTVDFYGRAVGRRTIETASSRILASGSVERIDVCGLRFGRGFVPYDPKPGEGAGLVRAIAFHSTEVGDWAVPLLKRFCRLETLDLRETLISPSGIEELRLALPGCRIIP
jgi:hypothetical protein